MHSILDETKNKEKNISFQKIINVLINAAVFILFSVFGKHFHRSLIKTSPDVMMMTRETKSRGRGFSNTKTR